MSWPPTSHTVKLMFLYSTVSTLKPTQQHTVVTRVAAQYKYKR